MTELTRTQRRGYNAVARRRIPATWQIAEPSLAEFATPAEIIQAFRDDALSPRCDAVVRSLARLCPDHPDAVIVLVEAVAPHLFARLVHGQSLEYRDSALLDLVCVTLDTGKLDGLDHLVRRLSNRAYKRTRRRWIAQKRRYVGEVLSDPGQHEPSDDTPIEDEVVIRVEFEAVRDIVHDALESGELTQDEWDIVRTGSIEPRLGFARPDLDKDYIYRRVRKVRELLAHAS